MRTLTTATGEIVCLREAVVEDARELIRAVDGVAREGAYFLRSTFEVDEEIERTFLANAQERGDLILVAAAATEVHGYIDQESQPDQSVAWIHHLVVKPEQRRQGIGSALLARGLQHGQQQGMAQVMTVVQSKNYPGIQFLQKHGFKFCGYNERFYRSRDIALYFVRGL